jgi:glyoxylase-like metal-dependent hydrolase (beta-lactamase superfamily II)
MLGNKITESIYLVGSDELSGPGDCLVYAIGIGQNEICLIDAGTEYAENIWNNIKQTPLGKRKITCLILTHCHYDHIGAAYQWKKMFPELKIYAHSWDREAIEGHPQAIRRTAASWYGATLIPVKLDGIFSKDRESLNLGGVQFQIIHTPGHTPGSISVLLENEGKKVLFAQDVHGPFMDEFNSNIEDWARSMKRLLALEADILCEGHYGIFSSKDKVKNYIEQQLRQHGF